MQIGGLDSNPYVRFNPHSNRKVLLRAISGAGKNFICPIKLLLASAMRLGAVGGTIKEILAGMASRADKTLQWADGMGSSPVLCGFATAGHLVIRDKPAMTEQAAATVCNASPKAGFLERVIPHDIRRGSAQDSVYLVSVGRGGPATNRVAAELGQSSRSLQNGITDDYVGRRTEDSWSRRVASGYKDAFGPCDYGQCVQNQSGIEMTFSVCTRKRE